MTVLLSSLLVGFCCGIIGAVYRYVLAYEKILSWWFRIGNRYESKWFFNPIWGCAKCFAGQLAGWFWLLVLILPAIVRHLGHAGRVGWFSIHCAQTAGTLFLGLLCAISAAITTAIITGSYLESKN